MTAVTIEVRNSNEEPIYLQVDPWAGVYRLNRGEEIEIIAESEESSPTFCIEESGATRILLLPNSSGYHVVVDGKRMHWTEYQTNL